MEYCKHGNLSEFLKGRRTIFESGWPVFSEDQNATLSHSDLTAISLQVALGMKFLLSRKVNTGSCCSQLFIIYIIVHGFFTTGF